MKIKDVIPVAARSGFFNRDLAAIKAGARADGFAYPGSPLSPGFKRIVQPGTAISVMLLLDDGQVPVEEARPADDRNDVLDLRHNAPLQTELADPIFGRRRSSRRVDRAHQTDRDAIGIFDDRVPRPPERIERRLQRAVSGAR